MALDYGKMEFAVSFKPITAFPLDSRSYYESLEAAQVAAASAVEAGSDQGTIYFGQTFVVVENGAAQMLQVQPDGTLSEIGGKIEIDEHQFKIDETSGKLSLLGFADAIAGAQPVIKEVEVDGVTVKQLVWQKPDTTTVDGLSQTLETLSGTVGDLETAQETLSNKVDAIEAAIGAPASDENEASGLYAELEDKADKVSVYTKTEVDTVIATAVAGADHLKRKIVESQDAIQEYINTHDDADQYIFMVPTVYVYTSESNKYDEYIVLKSEDEDGGVVYTIEPVGSWSVDLADYVSESELADYLKNYYTQEQVDNILKAYATVAAVDAKLEKYYTFEQIDVLLEKYYTEEEINALIAQYYDKTTVDNLLAGKVTVETGKSLVSDTEIAKLATVEENAEENFIKEVSDDFTVSEEGKLSLNQLEISDINNLQDNLDKKVDKVYYTVTDEETGETSQVAGTLLSPEDQKKLAALVIGDEGIQVSGKVNADNVEGLNTWITNNRDSIAGLYPTTEAEKVDKAINDLEALTTSVGTNTESIAKNTGDITTLTGNINSLTEQLNNYVKYVDYQAKMDSIDSDINLLKDAITWKVIEE